MPVQHAPTQNNGADGGTSYKGVVAGIAAAQAQLALPGGKEYQADQAWFDKVVHHPLLLTTTRKQRESYYKMLPDLTRGVLVPDGYPAQTNGLYIQGNTLPRIVGMQPGQESKTLVSVWPNTAVKGIKPIPPGMTAAQFIALKDTVVYQRDAKKRPITWFNFGYMHMLTYQPHVLFNQLFIDKKIFLDPSSEYANSQFQVYQHPTYLQGVLTFAAAVVIAVFAGYALGSLSAAGGASGAGAGAGSAGAAGGSTAGSLSATEVGTAVPQSTEALTAIDTTSSATIGGTIAPVSVGSTTALTAGGVVSAASAVSGVVKKVSGVVKAVLPTTKKTSTTKKKAAAPKPAAPATLPPLSQTPSVPVIIGGIAGIALLFVLAAG